MSAAERRALARTIAKAARAEREAGTYSAHVSEYIVQVAGPRAMAIAEGK